MATPLNLYATKVFAEQPLGLWALDDKADYISFLDPTDQDLALWGKTGVTSIVDATDPQVFTFVPPGIPFPEVKTNGVIGAANNLGLITFTSPFQLQPSNINAEQETFSFGLYVYSFSKIIDMRLGFRYKDPVTEEVFEVIKAAALSATLAWSVVAETFKLPEAFEDLELIIEVYYSDDQAPYQFSINGITAGQWAEEFQLKSFGTGLIDVPSSIDIPDTKGLEALPYGLPTNSGYYLADDNSLSARNLGLPLVFGSRNSTYIKAKNNSPSLIVPAFGFLNQSGQFNSLTAEFWVKIQSQAIAPRKIFGPISSDDGIYVEGPFLKLKIGKTIGSHYIGEWDRPMLVDLRVTPKNTSLIINGEEVIAFNLDSRQYKFVASVSEGKDQDWLGFYAYDDVPGLQLDCVAIYPYEVPAIVAKRRWVYGQAVEVPTDIKGSDSSSSMFVDYPFSKYARNYYFPTSSKWSSGSLENLIAEEDSIRPPDHRLPELRFTDKTREDWIASLKLSQDLENPVLTLNPDNDWNNTNGHIFFKNLNFLATQTKSFYGVFESKTFTPEKQTLFQITNTVNSNTIEIYTQGNVITSGEETIFSKQDENKVVISGITHGLATGAKVFVYDSERVVSGLYEINVITENSFSYTASDSKTLANAEDLALKFIHDATIYYSFTTKQPGGSVKEDIFYTTPGQRLDQRFFVGLDIPRFTKSRGRELASFLGTRQRLLVYVAGTQQLIQTFRGDIHRVGFCTERNLNKISHLFNADGVPVDYANVFDLFGPSSFDAGASYFEDDLDSNGNALTPPPAFWSLILDGGDPYDFAAITAEEHIASYTLIPKVYFDEFSIDVGVDSYWEDYLPLSYFSKKVLDGRGNEKSEVTFLQFNIDYPVIKNFENNKFDTSNAIVRSYVSFQYLRNGSNATTSTFTSIEKLNRNRVVSPGSNWLNTKYEVVDGTTIYPPTDVDINNISINVYLEFVVDGININPVKIRSLQLSSQSYGHSPNKIGTKFGTDLVPFSRSGQYFNYKMAPALNIYKGSSPYLYNTSDSGIELKVPYSNKNIQGISMPINKTAADFFKIGSMQMSLKYGEDLLPQFPVKIFEIAYRDNSISFFLVADSPSRKRGQIYAINDRTGRLQGSTIFFSNGIPVKRAVVYPNSWLVLGLSFPAFLSFSGFTGAIRFTSPIMFNNISYLQTNRADDEERFGFRQWFSVRSQLGDPLDWGYWAGKELVGEEVIDLPEEGFTWEQVLLFSSILREEIDASTIYNTFTGTERITSEGDRPFTLKGYQYSVLKDIRWSSNTVTPV
jgi:hypothetical protein